MKGKAATAVMAVIFSSLMFGALGLCTRYFKDCGLSSNDVVVIRLTISALGLVVLLALFARELSSDDLCTASSKISDNTGIGHA